MKTKTKATRAGAMLASVAILGVVSAARAEDDEAGRWYFAPQAGGIYTDEERGVESSDVLAGIALGRHLNERWSVELSANGASLSAEDHQALDLYGVSLDALRVLQRERSFAPYVTFGAGVLRSAPAEGASDTNPLAQIGAGIQWRLGANRRDTSTFTLRPELKVRWSDSTVGSTVDYLAHFGFQFSFGAHRAVGGSAPAPTATRSDNAHDAFDSAPDVQVARPAPEAAPPPPAPKPQPAPTILELPVVSFGVDSATLSADARTALDRLAETMHSYPDLSVELQGYTDSIGGEADNLTLSVRRAEAARDHLLRLNVPAAQVSVRGFGEARPVAGNDTSKGRARNRRVESTALNSPVGIVIRREQRQ